MIQKAFLALLNMGGLVNNLDNFLADVNILSVPVVCLTETHLRNSFNNSQLIIQNKMQDSDIISRNSSDDYKSLPLVFKKDMFAFQASVLLDGFLFVKLLYFCQFPSFKLVILYTKKNCSVNEVLQALTYTIQSKQPNIILGDFDESCLQKKKRYLPQITA